MASLFPGGVSMRFRAPVFAAVLLGWLLVTPVLAAGSAAQVHPYWQRAYVLSFRSPDLLTNEADEQWGSDDGRLVSGGILTDFPAWLGEQKEALRQARAEGRPILLSIHVHSGYGTGLVTYSADLKRAEVANYPWLLRQLSAAGLGSADVTVAVDTCNAQATAAHQIRPALIPGGVNAWKPFIAWRAASRVRKTLPLAEAYRVFERDYVATHLEGPAKGRRMNVTAASFLPLTAASFLPLTAAERGTFAARMYGSRGVILATPTFFNLLRLGPEPRGTLTANLLTDRLGSQLEEGLLDRNKADFAKFRDFRFLASAGLPLAAADAPVTRAATDGRDAAPAPPSGE
jgi:hypothetical protein